jgi:hypothetical protein
MAAVQTALHFVARDTPDQSAYWQEENIPYIMEDLTTLTALLGLG